MASHLPTPATLAGGRSPAPPLVRRAAHLISLLLVLPGVAVLGQPTAAVAAPAPACPQSRPDEASAITAARACKGRVEILSGRTERTQVFANPNGSSTMELAATIQRVKRPDGTWAKPDSSLHRNADGTLSPAASMTELRFSGGGTGPMVRWKQGGQEFSLAWSGSLNQPTVSGDTAVYADVLPGVDLHLRATDEGFGHVLVVKDRAAASNPALRELRFRIGGGLATDKTSEGGLRLRSADGKLLATSSEALMWDSTPNPKAEAGERTSTSAKPTDKARRVVAGMKVVKDQLVLSPPSAWLADRSTAYPVFIDPLYYGSAPSRWAYSNSGNITNSTDVARVGLDPGDGYVYRSYFEFPTVAGGHSLRGARIIDATFSATLYHSWSCTATTVSLWRTGGIKTTPRTDWNIIAWNKFLDRQYGNAHKGTDACGNQPDLVMHFRNNLIPDLQYAANAWWQSYTVGLAAFDDQFNGETYQERWKKFYPGSVKLNVTYNHVPNTPAAGDVATVPDTTCTTATPYATVNTTTGLKLQARLTDPDGTSLKAHWQVNGVSSTYAPPDSANYASGTTFQATVQKDAFVDGQTYSWRVQANDGDDAGGWSPLCYFVVDNTIPAPPSAASTELNLGTGSLIPPPAATTAVVGVPATVRLTATDPDVTGFRYSVGTTAATPTQWVAIDASGGADASVVPATSALTGNYLTVVAVDGSNNESNQVTYRFRANRAPDARLAANDVTGDGKSDVVGVYDAGGDEIHLWQWDTKSDGSGLFAPTAGPAIWGYPSATTRWLSADFSGDGATDLVAWRSESGGRVTLTLFTSTGNGFAAGQAVDAGVANWGLTLNLAAGDFDGNGRADIAAFISVGNCTSALEVWSVNADGTGFAAAPTEMWRSAGGGWCRERTKMAAGDFNGDGMIDLVGLYDYGNCTAGLLLFTANGSPGAISFAPPTRTWYQSTAGYWCWANTTLAVTDINGDRVDDLMALYDYSNNWKIWNFAGPALSGAAVVGQNSSTSDASLMKLFAGDFNGDGNGDVGHFYDYGNAQTKLWLLYSDGAALGSENLMWDSGTGQLDWNRFTPM